jgi:hypothetical protein
MLTLCSAPDTVRLPPSPHETASVPDPAAGVDGPVDETGAGDVVTTEGEGTATGGGGLEATSPGGRRVSTGSGARLHPLSTPTSATTPIAAGTRRRGITVPR